MYNAGHFLEAVVAYTRYREGIGSPDYRLYVAGKRFADEIVSLFGPDGTRNEVPGHEEIELALVKFGKLNEQYEGADSSQKYYDTAKIFIDRRGEDSSLRDSGYDGGTYSQDGTPFTEEVTAKGHSVRANYFWTGATDVATLLTDSNPDKSAYMNSLSTIWDAVANKKTYITGGIGTTAPSADSEGFGDDYVLPNNQSYCEICAAIAAANWNQRMNLLYEDGKYADMVEKNLYNAILVGTNLEGNKFYYSTLLEAASGNQRSDWFYCACCPPNLMRTLASVSGYMYTVHGDNLFVNMYIGSNGSATVNGTQVAIKQETNYPWEGAVKLTVNPAESKNFTMKIRIPGWVEEQTKKEVKITVNGTAVTATAEKGYVAIRRTWNKGDVVILDLPMEIRKTEADEHVTTNTGKIALQRGPIVYSLEKAGNQQLNSDIENFEPANIVIPRNAKLNATYKKDLLKGIVEITGDAKYSLYGELVPIKIQAVPYYAWNNRGDNAEYVENGTDNNYASKMEIWTLADEAQNKTESSMADDAASMATVSSDQTYGGARIEGVKMNWEPEASNSGNGLGWSNWYVEGGTEHWLQYDWEQPITTKQMQFYWFDNNDWDRSPATLIVQYKDADGNWKDATAKLTDEDGVFVNDQYNVVNFDEPITSTSMRLLMTVRTEPSTVGSIGCYRWKVIVDKAGVAANVENLISKIGTVECTSASRKLIYEARNAYDSISDEIKALVSNYADLEAAETVYNQLCEDAAASVIAAIDKIGTVTGTKECKALIDAARTAYEALTRAQKARVTNYETLVAAEELYVDKESEQVSIDKAAAVSVDHLIDAIGTVKATKESKALIDKARAAYDALTEGQKTYVTKLKTLVAAEKRYKELTPAVISITKATVSSIAAQKYTGKALTPAVKVSYKGKTLKLKTDYTVSYKSNKEIGTAKVIITGKGNYTGTVTKTFKIVVKKNSTYTVGNYKYKITNERTDGKGTVTLTGVKTKSLKSVKVGDTVTIGNKKFKVTVIGKSAFSGCAKAKSVVSGKNVTEIGEKAFYNCKALKTITIQTKSLKKVGKNAFKNINKKAVIKVPKSKVKAYQKLLKSAGQAKSVKIK